MKVFVAGGAGYIGSVCVAELIRAGHEVTVYDNLSEGHRAAVDSRARLIQSDLCDAERVLHAVREAAPDAILHFAAHALVGESMTHPGKYFRNNVANGINLLEAAAAAKVSKIVFSSTCAVYGIPENVPIREDAPLRPANPYGESKRMFELLLAWYQRIHGILYVSLRYFNAAGASEQFGEHHRIETHLIPNALRVAMGQNPACEVFGTDYPTPDGTCIRDYIHVLDLAQAHILAIEPGKHGIYNLGTGEGSSVREVIRACESAAGRKIKTIERPRRPGDPPSLVATAEKARAELGWKPKYSRIDDIVTSAWRWHQAHPKGYPD